LIKNRKAHLLPHSFAILWITEVDKNRLSD